MRIVGLDLGVRHIAYCEVRDGKVIDRGAVRSLSELASRLGPNTPPAFVAFESCREGWHVHDTLVSWGHAPRMLDTTRIRRIGVGDHRRKNDAIDAEAIAFALESGRVPLAHVLSPERRALRAQLDVRHTLVATRSQYVTTIRGLARAAGVVLPRCAAEALVAKLAMSPLDDATRALVAPLVTILSALEGEILRVEERLAALAERDPVIGLCATVPGVGLIVAATFVSVLDDAHRFRNAQAVGAYLGLVPSETTTGGPTQRRLGSITKHGNTMVRVMLVQSAWTILRMRDADDPLRRWADTIAEKRGRNIAAVALARKLACVMWAMCRDGTVYERSTRATPPGPRERRPAAMQPHRADALAKAAKKIRRAPSAVRASLRGPKGGNVSRSRNVLAVR